MVQKLGIPAKKPGISIVSDKIREEKADPLVKQIESEVKRIKLSDEGTMGITPMKKQMKKSPLVGP